MENCADSAEQHERLWIMPAILNVVVFLLTAEDRGVTMALSERHNNHVQWSPGEMLQYLPTPGG